MYFVANERIDLGDHAIKHAPTEKVWSDIFTKPTQVKVFKVGATELTSVPSDYNNTVEQNNTHPNLLTTSG